MVFSSAIFLLFFLPFVFVVNYVIKEEYSNIFLALASIVFYAWGEPMLVVLMLFSIVVNWLVGRWLSKTEGTKKKII